MKPESRPRKTRVLLSVPLSPEQKNELALRAGAKPVSTYARAVLFPANDNAPPKPARPGSGQKSVFAAKALALLGPASTSLKSIAQAMASGLLPFTPDTEAAVLKSCADIAEIKTLLMKALSIRER